LALATSVLLAPDLVEDITGLDISFNLIQTYLGVT
jgi:hypothetical protein